MNRSIPSLIGAAALLLTACPLAVAAPATRTVRYRLPDGSTALIRYRGAVAPSLTVAPAPPPAPGFASAPFAPAAFAVKLFGPAMFDPAMLTPPTFLAPAALFARMAVEQAAAIRAVDALQAGSASFSPLFRTVASAGGACVTGTSITVENGAAPRMVSFRSAGCGAAPAHGGAVPTNGGAVPTGYRVLPSPARPAAVSPPDIAAAPHLIEAALRPDASPRG